MKFAQILRVIAVGAVVAAIFGLVINYLAGPVFGVIAAISGAAIYFFDGHWRDDYNYKPEND